MAFTKLHNNSFSSFAKLTPKKNQQSIYLVHFANSTQHTKLSFNAGERGYTLNIWITAKRLRRSQNSYINSTWTYNNAPLRVNISSIWLGFRGAITCSYADSFGRCVNVFSIQKPPPHTLSTPTKPQKRNLL